MRYSAILCIAWLGIHAACALNPTVSVANTTQADVCALVKQQPAADQCRFIQEHCVSESLVNYVQLYYCHVKPAGYLATCLLQATCVFTLLLLFRILGSTAENFFSPILTQLSQELGLPPRLAGVTFLALGNGAPDISSSIAAVRAGQYKMALGSLLGGGMFVGCVVAGSVMLCCQGAKVRGALIRDVAAYAIAVLAVAVILWSGKVGLMKACFLLVLYALFVILVLAADIHHRIREVTGTAYDPELFLEQEALIGGQSPSPPRAALDVPIPLQRSRTEHEATLTAATRQGTPRAALDRSYSQPVDQAFSYNTLNNMNPRTYRNHAWAQLAKSDTFYIRGSPEERRLQTALGLDADGDAEAEDNASDLEAQGYVPPQMSTPQSPSPPPATSPPDDFDTSGRQQSPPQGSSPPADPPSESQDQTHQQATPSLQQLDTRQVSRGVSGSFSSLSVERIRVSSGSGGGLPDGIGMRPHHLQGGLEEAQEVGEQVGMWQACVDKLSLLQPGLNALDKAMDFCELPLTVLRRGTIPLLEQECYSKPWFIASLLFGPVMVAVYLGLGWLAGLIAAGVGAAAAVGAGMLLKDSREAPTWNMSTDFPIGSALAAAGGFVVAAMWIDTIASEVVGLLEYFGVLSGVDSSILGVTVLAWGNSIGDMATNTAMAKKGLGNMAITACYAGPVFNVLVGLGLGFLSWIRDYSKKGLSKSVSVELDATVAAGAAFIVLNSVGIIVIGLLNGNSLPAWYGKFMLFFYGVFLVVSVTLVLFA